MAAAQSDDDRGLTLSHLLKAPREQVCRAVTGPDGAHDLRAGGAWHTIMRSPEGADHRVSGVQREILPPERLVVIWG